jgi:tRNA(Ile)-lysidine synthase
MLNDFNNFLTHNHLADRSFSFLLAVSGGIDSVVMVDLFHKAGFSFDIAHANFQLRGEESLRDEKFVSDLANKCGVKVFVRQFDTAAYAGKNKLSIQVAARQLRYEWFEELLVKYGYEKIATAHHLDDQIETFLINLTRGTGIAGLHGIPVKQGNIIRPMMFTGRKEIEAYAADHGLDFVEDSSNSSVKYTRHRIRHNILPQLEEINPSFRKALTETIGYIRDAEVIYRKAIEETRNSIIELNGDTVSIPIKDLLTLEHVETWAYELLSPYGFNMANVRDIIGMTDAIPGKEVMSATHRLVSDRDHLIIIPREKAVNHAVYPVFDIDIDIAFPVHLSFEILEKIPVKYDDPADIAYLDLDKLVFPMQIRRWKRGDSFFPLGMKQRKKLSDFFTDMKFSRIDKENQWLLCSGDDIVWVIGQRIDNRYKITEETVKIIKIRVNSS